MVDPKDQTQSGGRLHPRRSGRNLSTSLTSEDDQDKEKKSSTTVENAPVPQEDEPSQRKRSIDATTADPEESLEVPKSKRRRSIPGKKEGEVDAVKGKSKADDDGSESNIKGTAKPSEAPAKAVRRRRSSKAQRSEKEKKRHISNREEFEEEKARILEKLPDAAKQKFGQIGFAKWGKREVLPVLSLSPYDVPCGFVRDQWFGMIEKMEKNRRPLEQTSYLVFWYGEKDPSSMYSFISPSNFIPYEKGMAKGLHLPPPKIRKKLEENAALNPNEKKIVDRLKQIEDDLLKDPSERKRGLRVVEAYETMTKEDVEEFNSDVEEEDTSDSSSDHNVDEGEKRLDSLGHHRSTANIAVETVEAAPVADVGKAEDFADDDVDGDDDFVEESVEDEQDIDYEEAEVSEKVGKGSGRSGKARKSAVKPSAKKKAPKKADKSEETNEVTSSLDKKLAAIKTFRQNEREVYPLLEKWSLACEKGEPAPLKQILDHVELILPSLTFKFIEVYAIPTLIKSTKKVFKEAGEDLERLNDLKMKMKTRYTQSKESDLDFEARPKFGPVSSGVVKGVEKSDAKKSADKSEGKHSGSMGNHLANPVKDAGMVEKTPETSLLEPKSKSFAAPKPAPTVVSVKSPPVHMKEKKKAFSLGTFMRPDPKESTAPDEILTKIKQATTSVKEESLPGWVTGPSTLVAPTTDGDRRLGYEFLKQMALYFPTGKVDGESVALSIEDALFHWASDGKLDNAWSPDYWERLHTIVGAVCGNRSTGSLMNAILRGRFASATELLSIPEEQLLSSYDGATISDWTIVKHRSHGPL